MAQYIFETDGSYVNFNGGGGLWRLARASNCIAWRFDETGDLFFDVYDQQYIVKAENISDVVIDETPLAAASDFPDAITAVFTGIGSGGGIESVVAGSGIGVDDTDPANPVVSATGGALLSATVELTDEQIKALPTTPIEIIAAPGANKIIFIHSALFISDTTAGAYGNLTDASGVLIYGSGEIASAAIAWQNFLNQTNKYYFYFIPEAFTGAGTFDGLTVVAGRALSAIINTPVSIADVIAGGSNYTGGNAANTLKVTVKYTIEDL